MADIAPFKGTRMRLVRLDDCGAAVTGATSQFITKCFVSIEQAPEYEDGEEFTVKNADGDLDVNEKDPDRLKRVGVTITLSKVNPAAVEMMTGATLRSRAGAAVGVEFGETPNTTKFALEVWNDKAGVGCTEDGTPTYPHWVLPWVENGRIGNITTEYGVQTWVVTASSKANPVYGSGPFNEWTPPVATTTHMAFEDGLVAPPDPSDDYLPLP